MVVAIRVGGVKWRALLVVRSGADQPGSALRPRQLRNGGVHPDARHSLGIARARPKASSPKEPRGMLLGEHAFVDGSWRWIEQRQDRLRSCGGALAGADRNSVGPEKWSLGVSTVAWTLARILRPADVKRRPRPTNARASCCGCGRSSPCPTRCSGCCCGRSRGSGCTTRPSSRGNSRCRWRPSSS